MSKRVDSRYIGGRSDVWVKTKCNKVEQFVIGGLTRPKGSKIGVESLLVGERQGGEVVYVGAVKIGLSSKVLEKWGKRFKALEQAECPFINLNRRTAPKRSVWLQPELLATVRYLEKTGSGSLRHATLLEIDG